MSTGAQILHSETPYVLDRGAVTPDSHSSVVRDSLRVASLAILLLVPVLGRTSAQDSPNQRLKSVTTIFVYGSDPLTELAREKIGSGSTCFTLAPELSSADAVLEIAGDSVPMENTVRATATLSLKSGGPAWSRAERVVMSRGFAMDLINRLVNRLAADAGCKTRRRK